MTAVARVNIWNMFVGAVAWNESRGYATFEFDKNFIKNGLDLAPVRMPLNELRGGKLVYSFPALNDETYKGLPGLLADSLPDRFGNKLIDAWLAQQGRNAEGFNAVERLCYIGNRGMGALEYEPVIGMIDQKSSPIEIKELVTLAKQILSERKNLKTNIHNKTDEALMEIIRVGTSAGGARAKAVIAYNPKTGDVRSGQVESPGDYEYWIIKFDGVSNTQLGDPKEYGRIEYAYHLMAVDCGITMTECRLLKENRRAHFMTKRFDRIGNQKLHMQTLCAIAHFDYNNPGAYSYEQAFQVMRLLKLPYTDMEELFRRMCFNVIARNQDDHTKNISFLMDRNGIWSLAPAYDVTYAYDPQNRWMKDHQMSINGKRNHISRDDLTTLAGNMNIKKPGEIIDKIRDTIAAGWSGYAKKAGIKGEQVRSIENVLLLKI